MKRLNKKDKLLRGEKWADWIRNVKDDIIFIGLSEWQELRNHKRIIDDPEKFIVLYELIDKFDLARKEVNQKDYNNMYHQEGSFLFDKTVDKMKVDVLSYQELIDICQKYQKYFISYKIPAYIAEFRKLPEPKIPLDNFVKRDKP